MNNYRKATAAFILNKDNELLVVQLVGYAQNEWTLPGGGVEKNESEEEAIWREIEEEVGLAAPELRLEQTSEHINTYLFNPGSSAAHAGYTGQQRKQFVFRLTTPKTPTIQIEEIADYKWVRLEDIEKYFIFPGQLENAKMVLGL